MNINSIYQSNSDYLKAQDIPPGREVNVKVSNAEIIKMDDKDKIALSFEGKEKRLVLNKTNAVAISHVYGEDALAWRGKDIILYSTKVDYAGQMVDAIRVRVVNNSQDDISLDDFI